MNAATIRKNTLENQAWLERALLALDQAGVWHNDQDAKNGSYMVRWIVTQQKKGVALGKRLTGDMWLGRGRALVQNYTLELMQIAYDKAKADAERYKELARNARKNAKKLHKELLAELALNEKGPATPAPTPENV